MAVGMGEGAEIGASAGILEATGMGKDLTGEVVVAMAGVAAGMVVGVMVIPLVAYLVGLLAGQ
jgi:hypothetical protein